MEHKIVVFANFGYNELPTIPKLDGVFGIVLLHGDSNATHHGWTDVDYCEPRSV